MTKIIVAFSKFSKMCKRTFLYCSIYIPITDTLISKRQYSLMSPHSVHCRKRSGTLAPRNILLPFLITHARARPHTH